MITYFIYAAGCLKVGKSKDLPTRLKQYYTHNPQFELIGFVIGDYEKEIHNALRRLKVRNEWFRLTKEESKELLEFIRQREKMAENSVIDYLDSFLPAVQKYVSRVYLKNGSRDLPLKWPIKTINLNASNL